MNKVIHGDCLEILKTLDDNSVDAVVTDPPYGISFMGKKWDYDVPAVEVWEECLRVLKPGGHILVACGTRTQHRMAVNIEDAGFEIRDLIAYVYGSGFPKSLDISKAIDKQAGAEREVVGNKSKSTSNSMDSPKKQREQGYRPKWKNERLEGDTVTWDITAPATPEAIKWQGWGTALKPAMELWTLARKPIDGTVANNVLTHGVGGLNIDGCRVPTDEDLAKNYNSVRKSDDVMGERGYKMGFRQGKDSVAHATESTKLGRFPANLIHDGSDEVVGLFPDSNGVVRKPTGKPLFATNDENRAVKWNANSVVDSTVRGFDDSGSAARFFYCAKASKAERNKGLEGFTPKVRNDGRAEDLASGDMPQNRSNNAKQNHHPTVKPVKLMQYLCRLITPPNGTVLDPYMGSGTTGIACKLEGFNFIGIEREKEYAEIAEARIRAWEHEQQPTLFGAGNNIRHLVPIIKAGGNDGTT